MRKTMLVAVLNVAALAAFGQGTITLGNAFGVNGVGAIYGPDPSNPWLSVTGQSSLDSPTGTTVYGGPLLTGAGYDAAFYAGSATAQSYLGMTLLALETTGFRTSTAGNHLPAGELVPLTGQQVPNIPGGTPADGGQFANYQIFVWSTADVGFDPWDFVPPVSVATAMHDWEIGDIQFGESPIETTSTTLGGGLQVAPDTIIPSFNLTGPTPEPASLVLMGVGIGSLLLFRRRKTSC
jgi:hypothetical protein